MNWVDVLLIALLAAAVFGAIWFHRRRRGCCKGCERCGQDCPRRNS